MSGENINFFVKVLSLNNFSAVNIHSFLENALGNDCIKVRRVQQLASEFKNGRDSVEMGTKLNFGKPRVTHTEENVNVIKEMIDEDKRISVRMIAEELNLPKSTVHEMIQEGCGYTSVVCRWVPYSLNDNHKATRVEMCQNLLEILQRRGMRTRLYVCDEKWIYLKKIHSGNHAKCWVPIDGAGDKADLVRKSMCLKKRMILVAGNFSGDFYFEILEDGGSINAVRYIEFIDNCFQHIQDNGTPAERILWMHDNARPHRALVTEQYLERKVVTKVRQPPYSPDLNLMDRYVFRNMENDRLRKDFADVREIQDYVTDFLGTLTPHKMNKEFIKLQEHCTNVIAANGSYL